jgi:predicted HTH domain antitoxin
LDGPSCRDVGDHAKSIEPINLFLPIPDDLGERLSADGTDLARLALEEFAVEEYTQGKLSLSESGRLLGFETRAVLDGFLKARGIYEACTMDDIEQDIRDLRRLGW